LDLVALAELLKFVLFVRSATIIFPRVRSLVAMAFALAACSGDRPNPPPTRTASVASTDRGSDALLLRLPRTGGVARVTRYPDLDSVVWTASDAAPSVEHVLAFDSDAGLVAAADTRNHPLWFDLRTGSVTRPAKAEARELRSVDGSSVYAAGSDGAVVRFTPTGNWSFKPPQPATEVFPQSNGTVVVVGGRGATAMIWRMRPPATALLDTAKTEHVSGGVNVPLGDEVFFIRERDLVGLRVRTLDVSRSIGFGRRILAVAATPSGDRLYVLTESSHRVDVVDRYQNRVTSHIELAGQPRALRVDPFGRYVLIRGPHDSVWVAAVGTDEVLATVQSAWSDDLPFVAPDGAIAVRAGNDVVFRDVAAGKELQRVTGGASDFWYPFVWTGFRQHIIAEQPVEVKPDSDTVAVQLPTPPAETTKARAPTPVPDSTKLGFTVSFAALLDEARAREQAAKISVNGRAARVVAGIVSGTTVYRVVLGPYPTRDEAEQAGRASGQSFVIYAGTP
jgi:cell division septation protein DedD